VIFAVTGRRKLKKRKQMTEAVNQDVSSEFVPPTEQEQVSPSHEQAYRNEGSGYDNQQAGQPEDDKAQNFKAIRESNARLQRENEELRQQTQVYDSRLAEIEKSMQQQSRPATPDEVDELAELSGDDWTTREQAEKLAERKFKKLYQEQREKEDKKRHEAEKKNMLEALPKRLNKELPDFDSVVTKDNVEYLKANKPHIASSLAANTDPYQQALSVYDAVKAFCPSVGVQDEQARMDKNATRPGTLGAAKGSSPLSQAGSFEKGLTPDLRKQLQKEMISSIRGS